MIDAVTRTISLRSESVTRINGLKWIEESGNEETVANGSPH